MNVQQVATENGDRGRTTRGASVMSLGEGRRGEEKDKLKETIKQEYMQNIQKRGADIHTMSVKLQTLQKISDNYLRWFTLLIKTIFFIEWSRWEEADQLGGVPSDCVTSLGEHSEGGMGLMQDDGTPESSVHTNKLNCFVNCVHTLVRVRMTAKLSRAGEWWSTRCTTRHLWIIQSRCAPQTPAEFF